MGVDAVDVPRFRQVLARTPSMIERCFTESERAYCQRANDPTERFAVRFAAREAAMKALGVGLGAFGFHDLEVAVAAGGAPSLVLRAAAADLAASKGVETWRVSLTHTETLAIAVVIALGPGRAHGPDAERSGGTR